MPKIRNIGLVPEYQEAATLNQAAPVNGTYYTILETAYNVEAHVIAISVATTGEDLTIKVTIDGVTYEASIAAVADTDYFFHIPYAFGIASTGILSNTVGEITWGGSSLKARSLKVEVKKTSANGAGNLQGLVAYNKW